jgi:hypothetical protein
MTNLTEASRQLFRRPPDERFETLADLHRYCAELRERSQRYKGPSSEFRPLFHEGHVALQVNGQQPYRMNDWSFTQLCGLAGVAKETVNRLRPQTAAQVFTETLADRVDAETDLQALVLDNQTVRAVNGEKYRRLWNADLVAMLLEYATDFTPPQKGASGGTGLYAGEQDMFSFLIDSTAWTEINSEAFAPGFFVFNSEVGKRSVGISTFWFQSACSNHVLWDARDIVHFTRMHTGKVRESLAEIRAIIEALVQKRDERKDGFAKLIRKAMKTTYGHDAEEVQKLLAKAGFTRTLAKRAAELAYQKGRLSLWTVVDALTQLARDHHFAGSRTEADQKASALLALAQ